MPEIQEFPKMLYRDGDVNVTKVVNSQEEEDALGDDWIDTPIES